MSRRARLFSEFLDGSDIGTVTTAPTAPTVVQDAAKRRKTSGLNSRFDRMIETLNVTHRFPTHKRARSTSSTSGSSVPRTPIDDYGEFHRDARLGADFAVIKMGDRTKGARNIKVKTPAVLSWEQSSSSSDIAEPPPPPVALPPWLASTFSTLNTQHPLRLLLPRRTNTEPTPSHPILAQDAESDANPFSFSLKTFLNRLCSRPRLRLDPVNLHLFTVRRLFLAHLSMLFLSPPQSLSTPNMLLLSFPYISPNQPMPNVFLLSPKDHFSEPTYAECASPSVPVAQMYLPEPTYGSGTPSSFAPQRHSTPPIKSSGTKLKAPFADFYPNHAVHGIIQADNPSPNHSAYIDLFSTPGPGHAAPQVYFDSPTEDPSYSDPLEPRYELDSLDFRWEPFIQQGDNQDDAAPATQSPHVAAGPAGILGSNSGDDYYYETRVEPEGEDDEDGQLYASINMGSASADQARLRLRGDSHSRPLPMVCPSSHAEESREQDQDAPFTPQRPDPPFFAPVGGIFISPLRGGEPPKTPSKDGANPYSSQVSNDTIEDWDETNAN
ncbi:hypothetical protein B0H14DRAFT_3723411 [Mycena olivaceomarginata]|nr:hypothetical protein B0H14DRAFT_3723411 [Mycena olivaceomarginata]